MTPALVYDMSDLKQSSLTPQDQNLLLSSI